LGGVFTKCVLAFVEGGFIDELINESFVATADLGALVRVFAKYGRGLGVGCESVPEKDNNCCG
jgi:hypothetical protein